MCSSEMTKIVLAYSNRRKLMNKNALSVENSKRGEGGFTQHRHVTFQKVNPHSLSIQEPRRFPLAPNLY